MNRFNILPRQASQSFYAHDALFALNLVDRADNLTLSRFNALDLRVSTKLDLTPVSDADTATESMLRQAISARYPADEIIGEELGSVPGSVNSKTEGYLKALLPDEKPKHRTSRRWIIDPIDGTKNFIRGVPIWATLIALEEIKYDVDDKEERRIVVGIASAPALGRRWWAVEGGGAYAMEQPNGAGNYKSVNDSVHRKLNTSKISRVEDASLSYSSLNGWEKVKNSVTSTYHDLLPNFLKLNSAVWRNRAYGDFWSYCLVAEGVIDCAAEPELNLYDMAALSPIVTEAGGAFSSLDGAVPTVYGPHALASNGLLHEKLVARLWDDNKPRSVL